MIDFVVIGPGKCGTSWMYNIFSNHPDICVSSAKETLYYESFYYKGEKWYAKFFKDYKDHQLKGEVSNTYIFSDFVPDRILLDNPKAKIISALRNPIERAFSHYLFLLRNGSVNSSFDDLVKQEHHIITRGRYDLYLEPYINKFPSDQVLLLIYDDLKSEPEKFANKIFNFLGVETALDIELLERKVLGAAKPRSVLVAKLVKNLALYIRKLGFPEIVTKIKTNRVITDSLYSQYTNDKPVMSEEIRNVLADYYFEHVKKLSLICNRDLITEWGY